MNNETQVQPPPTEEQKQQHLLPDHVTIAEYAELKGITGRTNIYNKIKSGEIVADLVGRSKKTQMINWEKYKDVEFRKANK